MSGWSTLWQAALSLSCHHPWVAFCKVAATVRLEALPDVEMQQQRPVQVSAVDTEFERTAALCSTFAAVAGPTLTAVEIAQTAVAGGTCLGQ